MCPPLFITLASLFAITPEVAAGSYSDMVSLRSELLRDYSKAVPPTLDLDKLIDVYFRYHMKSIQRYDEVDETFTLLGDLNLYWADQLLKWDTKDYGSIKTVTFNPMEIWYPELQNSNSVKGVSNLVGSEMTISVTQEGIAHLKIPTMFETICTPDITFYPFDVQTCTVDVETNGQKNESRLLDAGQHEVAFTGNGAWTMNSMEVEASKTGGFSILVTFDRKPMFVVINVLLPVLLMAVLHHFTFIFPVESGERLSFSTIVLLAIAVYLTLVSDNLPQVSEPLPRLSILLLANLSIAVVWNLMSIVTLTLHFNTSVVPRRVVRVIDTLRCICPSCCCAESKMGDNQGTHDTDTTKGPVDMTMEGNRGTSASTVVQATEVTDETVMKDPAKNAWVKGKKMSSEEASNALTITIAAAIPEVMGETEIEHPAKKTWNAWKQDVALTGTSSAPTETTVGMLSAVKDETDTDDRANKALTRDVDVPEASNAPTTTKENDRPMTWSQLSRTLDLIFFCVSAVTTGFVNYILISALISGPQLVPEAFVSDYVPDYED